MHIIFVRENQYKNYGLVRVKVYKSTMLNRKINGWIDAICNYWKV